MYFLFLEICCMSFVRQFFIIIHKKKVWHKKYIIYKLIISITDSKPWKEQSKTSKNKNRKRCHWIKTQQENLQESTINIYLIAISSRISTFIRSLSVFHGTTIVHLVHYHSWAIELNYILCVPNEHARFLQHSSTYKARGRGFKRENNRRKSPLKWKCGTPSLLFRFSHCSKTNFTFVNERRTCKSDGT